MNTEGGLAPVSGRQEPGRTRIDRALASLPDWSSLDDHTRTRLREADRRLPSLMPNLTAWEARAARRELLPALSHHLSPAFVERLVGGAVDQGGSRREAAILATQRPLVDASLGADSATDFAQALADLGRATSPLGLLRQGEMRTSPDRHGAYVRFSSPDKIAPRLHAIGKILRAVPCNLFGGVAALVLITNLHPLRDGNGRCGRMMFNAMLHRGGMPATAYAPLYEIFQLSQGGYEIRLRAAEINGDWDGLMLFFCDLIALAGE